MGKETKGITIRSLTEVKKMLFNKLPY